MKPALNNSLIASESILIHATPATVWAVLILPVLIKSYLFGTETSTDWTVGSQSLSEACMVRTIIRTATKA
jgi:hypothetical protein